jgi:hypothetical protein
MAILASGCSSVSSASLPQAMPQPGSASQPAPQASSFPRGRFSAVSAPNMVVLAIENDGSFRVYQDNGLFDFGKFNIDGPQVLVESMACAGHGDRPASYDWLYDNENGLAFQPVASDPCPERRRYLAEQYQPKYLFIFNIPDRGVSREWLW